MFAAPLLAVIGVLTSAGAFFAKPVLELQIDSCASVDAVEVGRVVAVELRVAIGAAAEPTTTQVSVGCRGPFYQVRVDEPTTQQVVVDTVVQRDYFEIRVDDPLTGKTLRRLVDLRREPTSAQARLLGIAISELVRASWVELVVNPTPRVPSVTKVTAPIVEQAVVERARATATTSVTPGCGELFFGKHGPDTGFGCGFGVRESGGFWQASASADVYTADSRVALGKLSVSLASLLVAGGAHVRLGSLTGSAELGARFGVNTASGEAAALAPLTGSSTTAAWGGPAARVALDVGIVSWLALGVSAEAGYAALGIEGRALGDTVVDTRGFWLNPTARLLFVLP